MKIAVDLRSLETPTGKRGIGYYNKNIFKELFLKSHPKLDFSLFTFPKSKLRKEFKIGSGDRFISVPALFWPKRGLRRLDPFFSIFWKGILNSTKPDLLHLPFVFDVYHLSIPENIKTIITIYDIIPLLFPKQYFQNRKAEDWYRQRFSEIKKVAKIITISKASKKDIIKILKIPEEKVEVIYGGIDEKFKIIEDEKVTEILNKYKITHPYILTISTHSFHKNIPRIFQAFKEYIISEKDENLTLTVVCKLTSNEEKDWKRQLRELDIEKKVVLTNFVEDNDLPAIYNGAEVFLFPSLYEGLGLPVLEAMACGVPVITSYASSLPEVGGDGAKYVNPENVTEIKNAISEILENKDLKSVMIKRGFEHTKKFSWKKAAKETLKVYEDVLSS